MEEKKLDRNQIIGFLLIGAIMLFYAWWSTTNAPDPALENAPATQEQTSETPAKTPISEAKQPLAGADTSATLATDSTGTAAKDTIFWIENNLLKIGISSNGAQIVRTQLKNYQTWDSLPLNLIDSNQHFGLRLGEKLSSAGYTYSGSTSRQDSSSTLVLTSNSGSGQTGTFSFSYVLPDDSYQLQINATGAGFKPAAEKLFIDWQIDALRTEKSIKTERQIATIYYWNEDDYHSLGVGDEDDDEASQVKWIAYKQHFFSSILQPGVPVQTSKMAVKAFEGEELTKRMASENLVSTVNGSFNLPLKLYYGPNKHTTLIAFGEQYEDVIDFGWGIFGWINRGVVIRIFDWLDTYGLNYGLIILIMAIILKIVLFPLTYTSYKSMAKMRVLKPEMDEINEKFKGKDAVKKNQATMELYQKAGVNPLGGCIPMLVQMPILIAMFRFFPSSIELRQKPFLWANDLSSFDSIFSWQQHIPLLSDFYGNHISLFTILMTISTLIYTWMNSQMQGNTNQIPGMKYIMYGMPIMLLFWFNSYSSGLSYYYFVANVITFAQQWMIRKTIDDDAIHAKLQANRANPKAKSKFQQRLEDLSKQQGKKLPK